MVRTCALVFTGIRPMTLRSTRFLRRLNAAQIAILSFAAAIVVGALLLMLPVATHARSLGIVDAFFTATSATCVTGLAVVDTGTYFTRFGQAVILFLIQVGGFGIMTLSTFILLLVGRGASLQMSDAAGASFPRLRQYEQYGLREILRKALVLTLGFEAAAVLILFVRWAFEYPADRALWLAVFHSVSAFCNAGFCLFPDSLIGYAQDPVINLTIIALIICGGIGFFVLIDLGGRFRRNPRAGRRRISFHTKIVLSMTVLLVGGGTLVFYALEHHHILSGMPWYQALVRAVFQSVTARTAGFNTVDIQHLSNASLFLLILLMFIGGAPGSMAGGIKVTTAGTILIVVLSKLRGFKGYSTFGRSISRKDVDRSLALIVLAIALMALTTMILLVTELGGVSHVDSRGLFLEIFFEYTSAFGTVGLSTGITPSLTIAGRIILTLVMFIGRLGPLTLVYALERRQPRILFRYPEEEIIIG